MPPGCSLFNRRLHCILTLSASVWSHNGGIDQCQIGSDRFCWPLCPEWMALITDFLSLLSLPNCCCHFPVEFKLLSLFNYRAIVPILKYARSLQPSLLVILSAIFSHYITGSLSDRNTFHSYRLFFTPLVYGLNPADSLFIISFGILM